MLLAKDVPYEWHDGVAVIAQLLEQLRPFGGGPQPTSIPDLGSIALENTGWLTVSQEPERELPIMPGAARLLQELLSGIDQPPQLRLYAMQTAGSDADTPLGQFADELSKWERPNRIPKLIALHARADEKIGLAALTEEAKERQKLQAMRLLERKASSPERKSAKSERKNSAAAASSSSSTRSTLIGLGLVLAAGIVATLEWRYVVGRTTPAPSTAAVETPDDNAPETAASEPGGGGTTSRPGTRRATPRTAPRSAEAPASLDEAPVAEAEAELERAQQLFNQQDYINARAAFERILDSLRGASSPQAEEIRQAARNLDEVARAAVEATALAAMEFRSGDPGVTPPVPEAYLPPKPDPRTPPDKLQVMELRINAEGNVDSAKFVINRPTYRNAWWPAAAKAWHFKPAMKDGRPVRYVMRIVMDDSDPGR